MDVELFYDVSCEVFQFDGRIAALVIRSRDELAERIGCYRNPFPRLGRKLDGRLIGAFRGA